MFNAVTRDSVTSFRRVALAKVTEYAGEITGSDLTIRHRIMKYAAEAASTLPDVLCTECNVAYMTACSDAARAAVVATVLVHMAHNRHWEPCHVHSDKVVNCGDTVEVEAWAFWVMATSCFPRKKLEIEAIAKLIAANAFSHRMSA